jgi:hypothetical protein
VRADVGEMDARQHTHPGPSPRSPAPRASGVQRADETLNCQSARRNDLLDCSITRRAESDAFDAPVLNVLAAKQ